MDGLYLSDYNQLSYIFFFFYCTFDLEFFWAL